MNFKQFLGFVVFGLAIIALAVYVLIHFIIKFW